MSDLTGFLLARIAEDESDALQVEKDLGRLDRERAMNGGHLPSDGSQAAITLTTVQDSRSALHPARVLAECEAKRRAVEDYEHLAAMTPGPLLAHAEWGVRNAASVYADHPDYREEWKP